VVLGVSAAKVKKWREYFFFLLWATFSISLSFYDGGGREKDILTQAYLRLIKHVNSIYKVGFLVLGRPTSLTVCSIFRSESHTNGQKTM
jgi:hypothetical protein